MSDAAEFDAAEFDQIVGANIQKYRSAKRMSQAELADRLSAFSGEHVHQQTIQKIEKGSRPLRYTEAVPLCAVLDIELQLLAVGEVEAKVTSSALRRERELSSIREQVQQLAQQLAPLLVFAALDGVPSHNAELNLDEATVAWIESTSARTLRTKWGENLDIAILNEVRRNGFVTNIKPDLAKSSTYTELLEKLQDYVERRDRQ